MEVSPENRAPEASLGTPRGEGRKGWHKRGCARKGPSPPQHRSAPRKQSSGQGPRPDGHPQGGPVLRPHISPCASPSAGIPVQVANRSVRQLRPRLSGVLPEAEVPAGGSLPVGLRAAAAGGEWVAAAAAEGGLWGGGRRGGRTGGWARAAPGGGQLSRPLQTTSALRGPEGWAEAVASPSSRGPVLPAPRLPARGGDPGLRERRSLEGCGGRARGPAGGMRGLSGRWQCREGVRANGKRSVQAQSHLCEWMWASRERVPPGAGVYGCRLWHVRVLLSR